MARHEATGEVRFIGGIWTCRIRAFGRREPFDLPTCKDRDEAIARSAMLSDVARRFQLARTNEPQAKVALECIAGASAKALQDAVRASELLLGGQIPIPGRKALTFKEVGEWWTSGRAHAEYPDKIDKVTPAYKDENVQRLERVIYPHLGPTQVDRVTRAECDAVMATLPEGHARSTRRQYAGLMNRILNLAELAGHVQRNPLPRGWLPRSGPRKRFPILYRNEDRALLACPTVPLARRILYGFLHREGTRRGEAADLQRRDVDLEHGTVNLDENKTDHPRFWKLGPGVPEAIEAWLVRRGAKEPDDRVFAEDNGGIMTVDQLAKVIRADLEGAEVTREDLFSRGPNKGRFGTHCFRRSMVTRNLALGRTDDWVRQRTGHKSEEILTYRQGARSLAELDLGDLDPLVLCLPELSPIPGIQVALAHLHRGGLDTRSPKPTPLPQHCPENHKLGDRLMAGRKILVLAI